MVVVVGDERNTTPDAIISIYSVVHAMGKTQLGGVRGDWFKDLYQADDADDAEEAEASGFITNEE
jgi:hypothetical protein